MYGDEPRLPSKARSGAKGQVEVDEDRLAEAKAHAAGPRQSRRLRSGADEVGQEPA